MRKLLFFCFLTAVSLLANAADLPEERAALTSLFAATQGPSWSQNNNWLNATTSVCDWYGVKCHNGSVVELALSKNELVGRITDLANLTALKNLVLLDLEGNSLKGSIPTQWGAPLHKFSKIQHLDLTSSEVGPSSLLPLCSLDTLMYLDLSYNTWSDWPRELAQLTRLTSFSCLYCNGFSGFPWPTAMPSALSELELGSCGFVGPLPSSWSGMANLTFLDLQRNEATAIPAEWRKFKHLHTLYLNDNSIRQFPVDVTEIQSLKRLVLSQNGMDGRIPGEVGRLFNLTQLVLSSNSLSGQVPESIGHLHRLGTLDASYNALTGLPNVFKNMTELVVLDLRYNNIESRLPDSLCHLPNLRVIHLEHNHLHSTLPGCTGEMPVLTELYLGSNRLEGDLQPLEGFSFQSRNNGDVLQTSLFYIDVSHNRFSGSLPPFLGNLSVSNWGLEWNSLSGPIPSSFNLSRAVGYFVISHNCFSGTLPLLARARSLQYYIAHHNCFDQGGIPQELFTLHSELKEVDVSYNPLLSGTLPPALNSPILKASHCRLMGTLPTIYPHFLKTLDLSSNALTGPIPTSLGLLDNLEGTLNLAENQLSGPIPKTFAQLRKSQLTTVDLHSNQLRGTLPELFALPMINLVNNRLSTNQPLPPEYVFSNESRGHFGSFSCPTIVGRDLSGTLELKVDPSYYGFLGCVCDSGYSGHPATQCLSCPPQVWVTCVGGTVKIDAGYFPTPNTSVKGWQAIPCSPWVPSLTACNPESQIPFQCRWGSTGRLCSECIPGFSHTSHGGRCRECAEAASWLSVLIACVALVVMIGLYLWHLRDSRPVFGQSMGTNPDWIGSVTKSALFFVQAGQLLLDRRMFHWPPMLAWVQSFLTASNVTFFGIECVNHDMFAFERLMWIQFMSPVAAAVLVGTLFLLGVGVDRLFYRHGPEPFEWRNWGHRCLGLLWVLFYTLYLPLVVSTLEQFSCATDPVTKVAYLKAAPYLRCDSGTIRRLQIVAGIVTVVFVAGIPILFAVLLFRSRRSLLRKTTYLQLGFLYGNYHPTRYWYELVLMGRRFLLALVIATLRDGIVFAVMVLVVLNLAVVVQRLSQPFPSRTSDLIEFLMLYSLIILFTVVLLAGVPEAGTETATTALVLNTLTSIVFLVVLLCLVGLLFVGRGRTVVTIVRRWQLRRHGRSGKVMMDEKLSAGLLEDVAA